MIVYKYNMINKRHTEVDIPSDWNIVVTSDNKNTKINCVSCGQIISYDDSFESKRYKNNHDRGYRECSECHRHYLFVE